MLMLGGADDLFTGPPTLSAQGQLEFSPAIDKYGAANYSVVLLDDGGTQRGGRNASAPRLFTLRRVLQEGGLPGVRGEVVELGGGGADVLGRDLPYIPRIFQASSVLEYHGEGWVAALTVLSLHSNSQRQKRRITIWN